MNWKPDAATVRIAFDVQVGVMDIILLVKS